MAEADTAGEDDAGRDTSNQVHNGMYFGSVIQGRNVSLQLPASVPPALFGLPQASPTFIGRDTHVEELLQGLAPGLRRQEAVLVASVAGLAGVGKTELVVQTAHKASEKPGWFPGGVLFIDMFGYDTDRRLSPGQALHGLLVALGVPVENIPQELQDRSRLYRSVLAEYASQKQRILVVIDNASSSEQVESLLPTDGTTAALLTSRHTLDVGARLHNLDILDECASVELLRMALFKAHGAADTRVADAPEDASEIARLCAGLPLALRIAAALLADMPSRPVASLSQDLSDVRHRLDQLTYESRAVRAALDLSYEQLSEAQARMFRLVALNPGPELSTEAAYAVTGGQPYTEQCLQELVRAHLVEPGAVWGRWGVHDLVRVYAGERAGEELTTADDIAHLLLYYLERATRADGYVIALTEPSPWGFLDRSQALAWLDAERDNLLAAEVLAESRGLADIARDLPMALENYLSTRGHWKEWRAGAELAVQAARTLGDQRGEARARVSLSDALRELNAHNEAIAEARRAAETFHDLGDRPGEGTALRALALHLGAAGQLEESFRISEQAVPLLRQGSNRHVTAVALMNYGAQLADAERYGEAIDALTESLAVLSQTSKSVKALALLNLGCVLDGAGRRAEAISSFQESIECALEVGGLWETETAARASASLGELFSEEGQIDQVSRYLRQGATLFVEASNDRDAVKVLKLLGRTLIDVEERREEVRTPESTSPARERNYEQAADALAEAIALTRRKAEMATDDVRHELADLLHHISVPLVHLGRSDRALEAIREALAILRRLVDEDPQAHQPLLAWVLETFAWTLARDDTQLPAALEAATEAVELATGLAQHSPDEYAELLQATLERKAGLLGELD